MTFCSPKRRLRSNELNLGQVPLAQFRRYGRFMSKKPVHPPFADVIKEVQEGPSGAEPEYDGVVDPEGVRWLPSKIRISAGQAHALAESGARVAWDPCGCGGYCGFTWFSAEEVAQLVAAGTPTVRSTKQRRGNISEWQASDGLVLVVAEDAVRWGDLLA